MKGKYSKELCDKVRNMRGLTHIDMAVNLGISLASFYNYKKEHLEFLEAVKETDTVTNQIVVSALLKRAVGFKYDEVTFEKTGKLNLEAIPSGEITTSPEYKKKVVCKEVIPDTTAMFYWLQNRDKENWKNVSRVAITDTDGNDKKELTDEEVDRRVKASLYDVINSSAKTNGETKSNNNGGLDVKPDIQKDILE